MWTKDSYEAYKERVAEFFSHGLNNLSIREDCHEPSISSRPCACCGDTLQGSRYECNGYNGVTQEVEEYDSICENCVYYAEYGQLDDTSMMDIESEG